MRDTVRGFGGLVTSELQFLGTCKIRERAGLPACILHFPRYRQGNGGFEKESDLLFL